MQTIKFNTYDRVFCCKLIHGFIRLEKCSIQTLLKLIIKKSYMRHFVEVTITNNNMLLMHSFLLDKTVRGSTGQFDRGRKEFERTMSRESV